MLRFVTDDWGARGTRREWLRIAGCTGLAGLAGGLSHPLGLHPAGLHSGDLLQAAPSLAGLPGFGKARSVILVYTSGGQSQLETWDPKPHAPREIRGEFAPIATAVPGVQVGEHLPRLAGLADRYTILRSVSHDDLDHGSASYLALTGHFHLKKSSNPPPSPLDYPTYGSVLQRVRPTTRFPYTAVHVNGPAQVPLEFAPGQNGGFLGRSYEPMLVGDVTSEAAPVVGLEPLPELPTVRHSARQTLLESLERSAREMQANRAALETDILYRQAFELLSTPLCRDAFNLQAEPPALRDRYGRHRSGQACLLARRLVEAGVPWISVIWNHRNRGQDQAPDDTNLYGWDTHNDIFSALRTHLLPRFDESFSALLEDLEDRGLLADTLVVCMGEFGRAPRIALERNFKGNSPGRKHWAAVYSIVMAGAGVARGHVVGSSDDIGGHPATDPITPGDIAATMFSALGVDSSQHFTDTTGRPFPIATGRPIEAVYGR